MLPDIEAKDGGQSLGERVAGIGLLGDEELSVIVTREPHPAGSEDFGAGIHKFVKDPNCRSIAARRSPSGSPPPSGENEKK